MSSNFHDGDDRDRDHHDADFHHAHHDQVRVLRSSLDNLTKERDKLRSDLQVIDSYDDGGGGDDDHDDGCEKNYDNVKMTLTVLKVVVVVLASICNDMLNLMTVS